MNPEHNTNSQPKVLVIHIIRHEDLVTRPGPELERLGLWLGVDPRLFPESAVSKITDAGIGKYRTGLTEHELAAVTEITRQKRNPWDIVCKWSEPNIA